MPGEKKRRHYKVEELKCREAIDRALASGVPYLEIVSMVKEKGESIGATSLWRYHNSLDRAAERIKKAKDQVKVLIDAVREQPNTDLAEAANQLLLQAAIERIAEAEEGFREEDLVKVGRLVANLERSGVIREKLKLQFAERVKSTAEEVTKVARGEGLSQDKAEEIRKKILGIV